jgi:hypothetical protein
MERASLEDFSMAGKINESLGIVYALLIAFKTSEKNMREAAASEDYVLASQLKSERNVQREQATLALQEVEKQFFGSDRLMNEPLIGVSTKDETLIRQHQRQMQQPGSGLTVAQYHPTQVELPLPEQQQTFIQHQHLTDNSINYNFISASGSGDNDGGGGVLASVMTLNTSNINTAGPTPVCYLCLDGGVDEADQPVRRDCACRGSDAGFVHLTCLAGYAEIKCVQASDMNEFRKPWRDCPSCHQQYQNELAVDIATEFVSFVRRQYADDTRMQVVSLNLKMLSLLDIFGRLQPVQKRETGATANVQLSLIGLLKGEVSPLPRHYSQMEAFAYYVHGWIAIDEGTEESARKAVVYFEKSLQVLEAIGDTVHIAAAKHNIAIARSKYDDGNNDEELMKAYQELYEMRVAEWGEEHYYTITAGKNYARILVKASRREEARDLLTKLLATSKQVLGPHYNTTKSIESILQHANKR